MENASAAGSVYVQTNELDGNRVLTFSRDEVGGLTAASSVDTGGRGDGVPHLTSQGSVVLSGERTHLLVTNAGSDDLSVFAVTDGKPALLATVATGGGAPKSVAEHDGLVYVLNTNPGSLVGFRLGERGADRLDVSPRELSADADPAQLGFAPDGSALVVTDRGTNSLVLFPVAADGSLGEPTIVPSSGPTPYGFAFAGERTLVVTEAFGAEKGKAAASSYSVAGTTAIPASRSVGNGRSEICWAVATPDGRHVFTTNFADGAVSRYAVRGDASIALEEAQAGTAVDGQPGLRDEALTGDGRFLYAIDADGRRIYGWAVTGRGNLDLVDSWSGLPATVAGLAAS